MVALETCRFVSKRRCRVNIKDIAKYKYTTFKMPILIKDYTWTQTLTNLKIKIPLSSSYKSNLDIFTTDSYLKIHYNPFLFEVFLLHEVDDNRSKCRVQEDSIVIDMVKKEDLDWEDLEKCLTKQEKIDARQKIHEKCQEEAKERAEKKSLKKNELDRYAVQQAMEIDSQHHALMDSRRDEERNKAMDQLEKWRININETDNSTYTESNRNNNFSLEYNGNTQTNDNSTGVKIVEILSDTEDEKQHPEKDSTQNPKSPKKQSHNSIDRRFAVKSDYVDKKKKEAATRVYPKLRETRQLEIKHTPRTFPTPSRESAKAEEDAWLKNIAQARRAIGFVSEDLRPEEQDPQWCKDKGDEFFRSGNFLGAISAYTHGTTLSDKLPSLFSNRAATHFALGNFNKCVNDCSTALDLMKPPCEGNRRSRAKCIARRAAALARMGYLNKAIDEMKAASKLLPEDENIKKDVYSMERAWEQNPDSD